jgi:hypothetical protein
MKNRNLIINFNKFNTLNESFVSKNLRSIIKYVSPSIRTDLVNRLKNIVNAFDFPFSELDDTMIEYLPFYEALEKSPSPPDEIKCDGESPNIKGEFCDGGRVLRRWGNGTRSVTCTKCRGTGVMKSTKSDPIYKFWFTQGGDYITTTKSDGEINSDTGDIELDIKNFIKTQTQVTRFTELTNNIPSRSYLWGNVQGVLGVFFYTKRYSWISGNIYEFHTKSGNTIRIYDKMWTGQLTLLRPKSPDPYTLNTLIIGSGTVKEKLRDADFALILDIAKLKSLNRSRSKIEKDRELNRPLEETDDEIREKNIDNYFKKISDNFDFMGGFGGINNLILRYLGNRNALFLYNPIKFKGFISEVYNIIKNNYNQDSIREEINRDLREGHIRGLHVSKVLSEISRESNLSDLYKNIEEIREIFWERIREYDTSTIAKIESLKSKLDSWESFLRDSRVETYREFYRLIYTYYSTRDGYLETTRNFNKLNWKDDLEELKSILKKMI